LKGSKRKKFARKVPRKGAKKPPKGIAKRTVKKAAKKKEDDFPKSSWWNSYRRLLRFVKRVGNARVPAEHVEYNFQLGQWVRTQRSRRLRLSDEQTDALAKLSGWVWDVGEAQWNKAYKYLLRYVKRKKHSRVPKSHIEDGFKLGQWVKTQRVRKSGLSPQRIKALEKLPGWVWSVNEARWFENYDYLSSFCKREKHVNVPAGHIENGFVLGTWLYAQRRAYQAKKMPKERVRLLNKLSKDWKKPPKRVASIHASKMAIKKNSFENMPSIDRAEKVYEALFGVGPVSLGEGIVIIAEHLRSDRLADYKRLRMDGSLAKSIKKAITACIKMEYVDKPTRGHIRAVLTDASEYLPEEWEFCLLESLGDDPISRDEAVKNAVTWAAKNLGLKQKSMRKTGLVYKRLKLAITSTIKTKEVRVVKQRYIQLAK
jgi:hypothetical protein